jgi:hypothetical protein
VVSASCGIGRGTIHHRLQAHWIASRRCSPGSCAAVSGRSSTHRIPEPRACTTCRLVFSIQGRRAVCNISCKRRRFFQSLHSFAVSGLGLGPFDSLNMLLRSRVDDVPDLDSADDAAMDRRSIRPTRLVPPLGPAELRQDRLQTPRDRLLRKPTTGIAGCCARVPSGHVATAPPSRVMNSRPLIQSPRRRVAGEAKALRLRAPWRS